MHGAHTHFCVSERTRASAQHGRTEAAYACTCRESITSQQLVTVPSNAVHGSARVCVLNIDNHPSQRTALPGTEGSSVQSTPG
jgi:hypothetical protein